MILGTIPIRVCVECLWIQESLVVDQLVVFGLGSGGETDTVWGPYEWNEFGSRVSCVVGLAAVGVLPRCFPVGRHS